MEVSHYVDWGYDSTIINWYIPVNPKHRRTHTIVCAFIFVYMWHCWWKLMKAIFFKMQMWRKLYCSIVLLFHGPHPNDLRLFFQKIFFFEFFFFKFDYDPMCLCVTFCGTFSCKRRLQLKIAGLRKFFTKKKSTFKISSSNIFKI